MKKKQEHPAGYWDNKERCAQAAAPFKRRSEFEKAEPSAYKAAKRNGWYDEIKEHMGGRKKYPPHYFDDIEHCKEVASKYKTLDEMRKGDRGCHMALCEKHPEWREYCCPHIDFREYLSDSELRAICRRYTDYTLFCEQEPRAYRALLYRKLIDKYCAHMDREIQLPYDETFTKEECKRRALKYIRRVDFKNGEDKRYYNCAQKNGWLDEVCEHMTRCGSNKLRCIYVATFDDGCAYVGLTFYAEKRWTDHLSDLDSSVFLHITETGLEPHFERLTDYMSPDVASKQEGIYKQKYADMGWKILNRAPTGSLGGEHGYTKEEVFEEMKKYKTLTEFRKEAGGYYESAYRSDYWEEVIEKMPRRWHDWIYTRDKIEEIVAPLHSMKEFRRVNQSALQAARRLGILEEVCAHFDPVGPRVRMTDEERMKIIRNTPDWKILTKEHYEVAAWLKNHELIEQYYPGQYKPRKKK